MITKLKELKKKAKSRRKGALTMDQLGPAALVLVTVAVTIAVGAVMLSEFQNTSTVSDGSTADSVIQAGLDALDTFGNFFTVLAIVVIGAIVIGLLGAFRGGSGARV